MFRRVHCYTEEFKEVDDFVASEILVKIFGNGELLASLYCSPSSLRELGAGYVVCEGYGREVSKVEVSGKNIFVSYIPRFTSKMPDFRVEIGDVFELMSKLSTSEVWKITGGTHSAAIKSGDDVYIYEDVSRSCAVDKVVGRTILDKRFGEILAVTCRLSEVIVHKAVNAKIPIIVSKSTVTSAGMDLAQENGVTLIGLARAGHAKIYTHPWRIKLK
ncbi:hypothetical protein B6U96_14615 [Archaeoglobales archaeon ex4484_92]|nr:MAG: hypothetical protein B6U96_14615 [Archaeoglobales archaeon ex4484_92]